MSIFTIPRSRFDWPKFARAVSRFVLSRGADEAFPIVEDGKAIFLPDHEELTLPDGMELEAIPDDPIEQTWTRLQTNLSEVRLMTSSPGWETTVSGDRRSRHSRDWKRIVFCLRISLR